MPWNHSNSGNALTTISEKAADGKSYVNPPAKKKSEAYTSFVSPITNGERGGFEYADCRHRIQQCPRLMTCSIHVYFLQSEPEESKFATELWERIRRECIHHLSIMHI
jgi:hypothetical protein